MAASRIHPTTFLVVFLTSVAQLSLCDDCDKFESGVEDKLPSKILGLGSEWGIALPIDKSGKPNPKPVGNRIQCNVKNAQDKQVVQKYFYAAEDRKSVYFKVPCVGYGATSGNDNTRTELKADPAQGSATKWLPNDGKTHWINVTETVRQLGPENHLTVVQLHGETSDVVKVQVKKGMLLAEFKESGTADLSQIALNEKFTICMRIKNSMADFWFAKEDEELKQIKSASTDISTSKLKKFWGKFMIFHAGAYSPEASKQGDYALVQMYDLKTSDHSTNVLLV